MLLCSCTHRQICNGSCIRTRAFARATAVNARICLQGVILGRATVFTPSLTKVAMACKAGKSTRPCPALAARGVTRSPGQAGSFLRSPPSSAIRSTSATEGRRLAEGDGALETAHLGCSLNAGSKTLHRAVRCHLQPLEK